MTVREILQRSASWLAGKGFEPARLEAELLLAHVLGVDRLTLYTDRDRPLIDEEVDAYRELLRRRGAGEPVAYLLGSREFYSLEFEVNPAVLIPRPETEMLVDRALALAPGRLLDLGTGTGCIAIVCATRLPDAAITATDVSAAALEVARRNAERHEVADRIGFLEGDLFAPLPADARFDLVACNPPYVADGTAEADVERHEPGAALFSGRDGLDLIRRVLAEAPDRLDEGGTLLVEIAEEQEAAVRDLAAARFERVTVHRDLRGLPRLLEASYGARQDAAGV